jgi:hypothetical protein
MQKASDQPPSCYGKMWSGTEKECVGGLDATYTDANGRHIRPPCDYQESCSIRTQAGRNVVPASSLTRPQPTNSTPSWQQNRPWQHPQSNWSSQQNNTHHNPNVFQGNYGIPQYLSVREPVHQPRGRRFVVELLRSMGKSAGHTIANFFDLEVFSTKKSEHDERG